MSARSAHRTSLRLLTPVLVVVGLLVAATMAAGGSAAATSPRQPGGRGGGPALAAPAQVTGGQARLLGATKLTQPLRLVIGLNTPRAAEEEAFLQSLQDKKSPNFHKYLTAAQWNARFAPSAADEARVVAWAAQHGLKVTKRYPNRLLVDVEGSVGSVQRAFGVRIENYRLGARSFYSNDRSVALPAGLAGIVASVQGMNSLQTLQPADPAARSSYPAYSAGAPKAPGAGGHANGSRPALTRALARSRARLSHHAGVTPGVTNGFYDPTDIYSSQAYDVTALNQMGHCCNPTHASGVTPPATSIAIATAGQHRGTDYAGFHNQYPYLAYHYQEYFIDGTPACCDFEGTMDFEWSTAMANSFGSYVDTAMVYMYDGANNQLGTFTDIWNHMLSDGVARTMSTSWGCAERYCYDAATMSTDHSIFNAMLGQGWTLVGISHDHGPYSDCAHVVTNYPGSDPDLVSAGGTTLRLSSQTETAWTGGTTTGSCANNNGGGGGGCSAGFPKPPWQGVATMCPRSRAVPDLSLNASIGQNTYWNGGLVGGAGTSIVAPELAGIFAQANAYLRALGNACGSGVPCPTIGDPDWDLYNANGGSPHHPYYDVTSGCTGNDIGSGYCAGPGYDLATGLGSANLFQLVWSVLWFNVPEATPPTVAISGPSTGSWHNTGTVSWTVADSGGSHPATGVAGYTYRWDADPGDPTGEPHGGTGNSFYAGPIYKNATTGSASLASAGPGCHTLYVRSWDNIGDSAVVTDGPLCYDGVPPVLGARPDSRFVRGRIVNGALPVRTTWAGSDSGSGLQGYLLYRKDGTAGWAYQGLQATAALTQYLRPGHRYQYAVYALDRAGNYSALATGPSFTVRLVQESARAVSYTRGWRRVPLAGASGGAVAFSSAAGRAATFHYTGTRVAWVTTLGVGRGSAAVSADGARPVTINTHARRFVTAAVAYTGAVPAGAHTLTVRNRGGSPRRVDVDAFAYLGS